MWHWIIVIISLAISSVVVAETIYSWTDTKGIVHYGDSPPESAKVRVVDLPELTIIKDYGKLYQPVLTAEERGIIDKNNKAHYTQFSILAPKDKQAIRANDGDVTVILSLKPKLLPEHQLSIFLDDKPIAKGGLWMINLTNLNRGEHTVYAIINDKDGKQVVQSKKVVFTVVR
jgi:hypothetical protein